MDTGCNRDDVQILGPSRNWTPKDSIVIQHNFEAIWHVKQNTTYFFMYHSNIKMFIYLELYSRPRKMVERYCYWVSLYVILRLVPGEPTIQFRSKLNTRTAII